MSTDAGLVRQWLTALGVLVAGRMDRAEAEAKLAAYAPLLAAEYAPDCFTPASLAAVARRCRFFPSYAELTEALGGWWREQRRDTVALPRPVDAWGARVEREKAEAADDWRDPDRVRQAVDGLIGHPLAPVLGAMLAALVARHAPGNEAMVPVE